MAETSSEQVSAKVDEELKSKAETNGEREETLTDEATAQKNKEDENEKPPSSKEEPESIPEQSTPDAEEESDSVSLDPRNQKWSEALKAKLFACSDKDGNYFSYMFLDKIFGEARRCSHCRSRGNTQLPPNDDSLELYVIESGIIGKQNVQCGNCTKIETIVSGEEKEALPTDQRLRIRGPEIRDYCKKINHYEVLHDLMEMLQIAATEDESLRREKHTDVANFMLRNARKVCEEWCRAEYAELRLKKFLRLREESLLTTYKPTFTPDNTEEYKEMYEMMAGSFRQNRDKVLLLLQLMKESLIDSPTRSTFMMWVSIAMMHSENYNQFKEMYDPRSFMRVDSSEYQALQDRYLALNVPLGVKKIPVVFLLFEVPRFYHYVDFLNRRLGKKKPRSFLTDIERARLQAVDEESRRMGFRRLQRTGMMVSPEAHLDFLTRKGEMEREMMYKSYKEKDRFKVIKSSATTMSLPSPEFHEELTKEAKTKTDTPPPAQPSEKNGSQTEPSAATTKKKKKKKKKKSASTTGEDGTQTQTSSSSSTAASTTTTTTTPTTATAKDDVAAKKLAAAAELDDPIGMPPHHPRMLSSTDFRSMLVEHLKANEASVGRKRAHPSSSSVASAKPEVDPNSPLANVELPPRPGKDPHSKPLVLPNEGDLPKEISLNRNSIRRARKESRRAAKKSVRQKSTSRKTVLCAQVDTEVLRAQGFKVNNDSPKTTVIANKDGTIEHVLEGLNTPEEVRAYLARKYNVLSQEAGSGYITMPSKNDPGALIVDPGCGLSLDENDVPVEPKLPGNPKKAKKRAKQQQQLHQQPAAGASGATATPTEGAGKATLSSSGVNISGLPFTSNWSAEKKQNFGHHLLKGIERKKLMVKDNKEVDDILCKALEPADLGDQLGPAPRYIVPFGAGNLKIDVEKAKTAEDLQEMIEEASKPIEQMRALDAMGIPYKLETTHVYRPALDENGEEIPDAAPRLTVVSKITLLPKDQPKKEEDAAIVELLDDEEEEVDEDVVKVTEKKDTEELPTATAPPDPSPTTPDEAPTFTTKSSKKRAKQKRKNKASSESSQPVSTATTGYQPQEIAVLVEGGYSSTPVPNLSPPDPVRPIDDIDLDDCESFADNRPRKTARDKFKTCENCQTEIVERILVCAGCKKVAYCNYRCQKANWKTHKRSCSYALKKDAKDCTG